MKRSKFFWFFGLASQGNGARSGYRASPTSGEGKLSAMERGLSWHWAA
jgi:hypothetical protein